MRLINSTSLVFVAIIVLVVGWIGSGMLTRELPQEPQQVEATIPMVAASWSEAEPITLELVLYGDVEPVQVSRLRARTDGTVEYIVAQGARVGEGDTLVSLSVEDREARLARAQAQLSAAQRDFESAQQLMERGVGTDADAQTRFAQLEAARAEMRAIELEIANTQLRAPISGVVNRVIADEGAYLSPGGEVLEIVDNDPLIAVVQVQQMAIGGVRTGMPARVAFLGGTEREGEIRFVSSVADAATRTFRVEVEIANPDGELPSGLSAEVTIPIETVQAHRVSAALGRLDERGRLGLHIVNEDDRIAFAPVEIVRARTDGVWVTGLPDRARIVTISHGSLAHGRQVEVRETPPEFLEIAPRGDDADAEAAERIDAATPSAPAAGEGEVGDGSDVTSGSAPAANDRATPMHEAR